MVRGQKQRKNDPAPLLSFLQKREGRPDKQLRTGWFENIVGLWGFRGVAGTWPWSFREEEYCFLEFKSQTEVVNFQMNGRSWASCLLSLRTDKPWKGQSPSSQGGLKCQSKNTEKKKYIVSTVK